MFIVFTKILVPLDSSQETEVILHYVSRLAAGLDVPVTVLSVVDERGDMGPTSRSISEKEAKTRIQEVARGLREGALKTEAVVTVGMPAAQIVAVADRLSCDLIAMTSHSKNILTLGVLGSVTDEVVHTSQIPVLTMTPQRAEMYRGQTDVTRALDNLARPNIENIMVLLDGTLFAETVLPYVVDLAQRLSLKILLVRAVSVDELVVEEKVADYLDSIVQRLQDVALEAQSQVLVGRPAESVIQLGRQWPHDIVALATHTRDRWALGSVAEALVRGTGDPILVVTPTAKELSTIARIN